MKELFHPTLPEQASSFAAQIDQVFYYTHYLILVFFFMLNILLLYFVVVYRKKSENDQTPDIRDNHKLEMICTVIPTILVILIFIYGTEIYAREMRALPEDAEEIVVKARQWSWTFNYDTGKQTNEELIVPLGRRIKMLMKSEDVIHSLYIPAFRIKEDIVPNIWTYQNFTAIKKPTGEKGYYDLFCTEYCGKDHWNMMVKVKVVDQKEYDAWKKDVREPDPTLEQGQKTFAILCSACHSTEKGAPVKTGPNMYGLFGKMETLENGEKVLVDENYFTESVRDPGAKIVKGFKGVAMTPFSKKVISDNKLESLIMYVKSLKD